MKKKKHGVGGGVILGTANMEPGIRVRNPHTAPAASEQWLSKQVG